MYIYIHIHYKNVHRRSRKIPLSNTESMCAEATTQRDCRDRYCDKETSGYNPVSPCDRDTHDHLSAPPYCCPYMFMYRRGDAFSSAARYLQKKEISIFFHGQ